ncbi:hypothetical protein IVB30_31570 [Bradyrhizobium sp. 200]|nr:hypothetical protein IVB30_31570 [Bradyrhizobium sp. 200]
MNNRNLRTFETKLATSETLAPHYHRLPDRRRNQYLRTGRSHASFAIRHSTFLVGQSLTRQANVTGGTRVLLSPGASLETGALFQPSCVRSRRLLTAGGIEAPRRSRTTTSVFRKPISTNAALSRILTRRAAGERHGQHRWTKCTASTENRASN